MPESVAGYQKIIPTPQLGGKGRGGRRGASTQRPQYLQERAAEELAEYLVDGETQMVCVPRPYQLKAIYAIEKAVGQNKTRFLLADGHRMKT